jgi:ferredoxin
VPRHAAACRLEARRALAYDALVDPLVRFLPLGRAARVPAGTSLLAAARQAGVPLARACDAAGVCGRCAVHVVAGAPDALSAESETERAVKRRQRVPPELRLACCTVLLADVDLTTGYW